jgi:DNA-binding transcriptional LysR family regulator
MIASRRFLPSISSLLALESVARLGSATAAAEELSLTHSAVSRQLKVLEEQIGVQMLVREGKGLSLTNAGAAYAQSVRGVLQDLARASHRITVNGGGTSFNLAILPTFGMYWLSPRLRDFAQVYPEVVINQATRVAPFDFTYEPFDAAIHFGERDWPGVNYLPLAPERMLAVCAPNLARSGPLASQELAKMPLLHLETRPGLWERWFTEHGLTATPQKGMLFDQFSNMAEAAAQGMGVALLPDFLARSEIARGRLVQASTDEMAVDGTYYLVWPKGPISPSFAQFLDFLRGKLGHQNS